jgi:tetratricopeptide (TPR) repeat protein
MLLLKFCILVLSLLAVSGCGLWKGQVHSARAAFPLKYFYHPSYEAIGAAYTTDPSLAIQLLARQCRKHPENLAYRLTLADMYKDQGRVNDAIRLWFEILAMSQTDGGPGGNDLEVYFIPIVPYQEEGMRPYTQTIDKSFAYYQIGLIFEQNSFWKEAAESFAKAAEHTKDPNRQARMLSLAGASMGAKKDEYAFSGPNGKPHAPAGSAVNLVDPMAYRKREKQYYEEALTLAISDQHLRRQIEERLHGVTRVIAQVEGTAVMERLADAEQEPTEAPVPALEPEIPERTATPVADLQSRALRHFELGDLEGAVPLWQERFQSFPEDSFLIEVALNCRADSLVYTFDKLGNPAAFFVLPKVYQGRQCYRLFLGAYPDEEAARGEVAVVEGVLGKVEPRVWATGRLQRILSGT